MPLVGDAVGSEYADIVHPTVCDREGNFSIIGLSAGDWLVATSVNWSSRNLTYGGLLVYKVRLGNNKELVQIVMNERDLGIPR